MTGQESAVRAELGAGASRALIRWECRCRIPPVLLATYDTRGRIHIKARDRYWHVDGVVQTVCPRCGSEHTLDMGTVKSEVGSRESEVEESRSREVEKSR